MNQLFSFKKLQRSESGATANIIKLKLFLKFKHYYGSYFADKYIYYAVHH